MRWKRIIFLGIILLLFFAFMLKETNLNLEKPSIESEVALLIDAQTGSVLFEKNVEKGYPVASMSKLMTELLVLDAIQNGTLHWNDHVPISSTANNIGGNAVSLPINPGDYLSVEDLFKGMVIASANNAAIALAEYIAGTEEQFTLLMNEKAKELKLSNKTKFVNSTGLPHSGEENRMSAKDVAKLAQALLKAHGDIVLQTANLQRYYISSHDITVTTTNKMLNPQNGISYFEGLDGLKTGYTDAAGYCFTSTAVHNGKRLITVVMNAENDESRFIETKKLLSYGFEEDIPQNLKTKFLNALK